MASGKELGEKSAQLRARLEALKNQGADSAQMALTARTLRDIEDALATWESRVGQRNARLRQLKSRLDDMLGGMESLRRRAGDLRQQAEAALDERVLAYVEAQDKRMVYALDKSEQQIAHLYEYLALESLQRGSQ